MPDVLQIGPFQLQGRLLALLLACALGLWLIRRVSQCLLNDTHIVIAKPIEDLIFNSAIIVLLTWKLGVIVTQPSLLWNNPLKLLMVSGSITEIALGVLIACIYMYYQIRKDRTPLVLVLDVTAIGITASVILFCALIPTYGLPTTLPWGIGVEGTVSRFHPYHAYISRSYTCCLFGSILLSCVRRRSGQGVLLKYSLLYGGAAGMLASFFAAAKPTLLYLSFAQLLFLLMLIIGMLLPVLSHNTGRKELSAYESKRFQNANPARTAKPRAREAATPAGKEGFVDKKLDGPNRPST